MRLCGGVPNASAVQRHASPENDSAFADHRPVVRGLRHAVRDRHAQDRDRNSVSRRTRLRHASQRTETEGARTRRRTQGGFVGGISSTASAPFPCHSSVWRDAVGQRGATKTHSRWTKLCAAACAPSKSDFRPGRSVLLIARCTRPSEWRSAHGRCRRGGCPRNRMKERPIAQPARRQNNCPWPEITRSKSSRRNGRIASATGCSWRLT